MQNLDDLTVLILTYRTPEKIILDCLKSLDKNIKILIVENSNDFTHKNIIKHEFPNVKIICTGDNLGYAEGNNFGLKHVKTDSVYLRKEFFFKYFRCDKGGKRFYNNWVSIFI